MLQRVNVSMRLNTQRIIHLFGGMTLLFLATMLSSFAAHDVAMLLQHVETELKSPLTFHDGVADLYIILQESSYKDDPTLEHKLISLIKQAQRSPLAHQKCVAPAVAELSHQAINTYANSRYGLELAVVKEITHHKTQCTESTSTQSNHKQKAPLAVEHNIAPTHPAQQKTNVCTQTQMLTSSIQRRKRTTTPRKKSATTRTSRKKTIAKSTTVTTKKGAGETSSTTQKQSLNEKISATTEKLNSGRTSRARAKKAEASTAQQQNALTDSSQPAPAKKPRARKKASS